MLRRHLRPRGPGRVVGADGSAGGVASACAKTSPCQSAGGGCLAAALVLSRPRSSVLAATCVRRRRTHPRAAAASPPSSAAAVSPAALPGPCRGSRRERGRDGVCQRRGCAVERLPVTPVDKDERMPAQRRFERGSGDPADTGYTATLAQFLLLTTEPPCLLAVLARRTLTPSALPSVWSDRSPPCREPSSRRDRPLTTRSRATLAGRHPMMLPASGVFPSCPLAAVHIVGRQGLSRWLRTPEHGGSPHMVSITG